MVRLIDADALKEGIKELKQSPWYNNDINPSWKQGIKDAVHVVETLCIDEEPTVDAVPVIRCKDCRFWDWMPASTATPDYHLCRRPFQKIAMTEHDFCSRAERRDDD